MSAIAELETARLRLRGVTADDAPAIQRYFDDYAIIGELSGRVPWPYPANGALLFVNEYVHPWQGKDHWIWGLFLKSEPDALIGVVDLWRPGRPENRGFWLARPFWDQGLMSEAAGAVTDYAFLELGFETLVLANAVGNIRSRRIKEKAGAVLLRTEPFHFINPAYTEREIWELTKASWLQKRGAGFAPHTRV